MQKKGGSVLFFRAQKCTSTFLSQYFKKKEIDVCRYIFQISRLINIPQDCYHKTHKATQLLNRWSLGPSQHHQLCYKWVTRSLRHPDMRPSPRPIMQLLLQIIQAAEASLSGRIMWWYINYIRPINFSTSGLLNFCAGLIVYSYSKTASVICKSASVLYFKPGQRARRQNISYMFSTPKISSCPW